MSSSLPQKKTVRRVVVAPIVPTPADYMAVRDDIRKPTAHCELRNPKNSHPAGQCSTPVSPLPAPLQSIARDGYSHNDFKLR